MTLEFLEIDEIPGIIVNETTLIDVRAECEWASAGVPSALNLPILSSEERATVGETYKRLGQPAAIELGHRLVSGSTKRIRINAWIEAARAGAQILYCARGGMRSAIAQEWLGESGIEVARIRGGYKSLRRCFLHTLSEAKQLPLLVLTGQTGTGKTELIRSLADNVSVIDLERLANHRGSAFGGCEQGQPAQATFENALAAEVMRRRASCAVQTMLVEDESRNVGRCIIPSEFFSTMKVAPLILLRAGIEERVERIWREYVVEPFSVQERDHSADSSVDSVRDSLLASLLRIQRALGGARTAECCRMIEKSFTARSDVLELHNHQDWIVYLLEHYYDPYYDRHIQRSYSRILHDGTAGELKRVLQEILQPEMLSQAARQA